MTIEENELSSADGTALFCRRVRAASARGAVVIVHGVGDHSGRYRRLEAALSERGFTVYGYDQRGHGRSGGARADVRRFDEYVADLDRVHAMCRAQIPDGALFAFGHSMGSLVLMRHAIRHPDRWQGIIAAGCPVRAAQAPPRWLEALGAALAPLAPRLRLPSGIASGELTHDASLAGEYERDPLVVHGVTLRWGVEFLTAARGLLRDASRLTMPVLMLHGGADPVARVEGARAVYERIGAVDKSLRIYPGLFHELHNERPADRERVFADMTEWLGAHRESANSRAP